MIFTTHPGHARPPQAFIDYCAACHGEDGRGVEGQGANLAVSSFKVKHTDAELKDFIMMGRQPDAPDSVMKLLMPAFDYLTDDEMAQVIAYVRSLGRGG